MATLKLAVPDLITNSYFPALAAAELGFFKREGIEVEVELVAPADRTFRTLRDGGADLVAAEAHGALAAFPEWAGMKFLCALSQGMYWFLVMHVDIARERGDLSVIKGRKIAAAPWVEMGLRRLLAAAGLDPVRDDIDIAPLAGSLGPKVNIGVTAAKALLERRIDGFWANGMGAELAVRCGAGRIVLDVRRGDGPKEAFGYTFPALVASERLFRDHPEAPAAAVRAITATLEALKRDVSLATLASRRLFPEEEQQMIATLIARDLPYYDSRLDRSTIDTLNSFARAEGILRDAPAYESMVAADLAALWKAPSLA